MRFASSHLGHIGPLGQRAASNQLRAASSSWKCFCVKIFLPIGVSFCTDPNSLALWSCGVNYVIGIIILQIGRCWISLQLFIVIWRESAAFGRNLSTLSDRAQRYIPGVP